MHPSTITVSDHIHPTYGSQRRLNPPQWKVTALSPRLTRKPLIQETCTYYKIYSQLGSLQGPTRQAPLYLGLIGPIHTGPEERTA